MRTAAAVGILAAAVGIVVWIIRIARRDYRELRASSDRGAPAVMMARARIAGVLVGAPVLALFWLDPPARTWVGTAYLVAVIIVLGWIVIRRRKG